MGKFTLLTSIQLDTSQLKQGADATKSMISSMTGTIKDNNAQAGNSFTQLSNKVAEPQMNLRELMRAYRELSKVSFAGKSVEEIEQIKAKLASLYDQLGDLNNEIKAQSKDPFEKYAQGAQGLSTMLQGVVGVQTLMGGSSERLNELMQRTVALMGVSNALQQASVFFKENALGIEIRLGVTKIANLIRENALQSTAIIRQQMVNAAQVEGAGSTGILTTAQLALNAVMAANPIGLIIAGVVALAAVAVVLAVALSSDNDEFEKQAQLIASLSAQQKSLIRDYERTAAISKASGESDLQLLKDKLAELYKEDNLNQQQIDILKRKIDLTDEEKKQYDDLIKKRDDYTNAINDTNTAIQASQITQLKDAEEFKNQLIISMKTGKAGELAVLEDWKNKSIEKYKDYGDVVGSVMNSYNAKLLAINNKYNGLALAANATTINSIAAGAAGSIDKQIAKLNDSLEGIESKDIELKLKPIATNELITLQDKIGLAGNAMTGLSDAFITMAETGKLSVKGLMVATLGSIRQIIMAKLAEAMMSQTASNSKFGLPGLAMAAVGITGVMALFAKLPKFETGGIVGGYSYSGDKIPAMVNSGEMVLNTRQQANLFDLLNNGGGYGDSKELEFVVKGDSLVAVLNKVNRKNTYR